MLREKRNIELWRMSKVLYQLWDWWRLQGNTAGHNDAPKLKKKKKEKKKLIILCPCKSRCHLALLLAFWATRRF